MGMGTRKQRQRQEQLRVTHTELAEAPGHPFYKRLNELLEGEKFDEFCERECAQFYAKNNGRPSLTPGTYFRLLLVGYFEGIDSERGIAWRAADSLGLREFLRIGLDEETPNHSTISRTRRLIDVETHRKVFVWGVSRRQAKNACQAALKMGVGLPKPTYRRRLQTTWSCCVQKAWG
jgi:transposase